jgi:hypothetical protein
VNKSATVILDSILHIFEKGIQLPNYIADSFNLCIIDPTLLLCQILFLCFRRNFKESTKLLLLDLSIFFIFKSLISV